MINETRLAVNDGGRSWRCAAHKVIHFRKFSMAKGVLLAILILAKIYVLAMLVKERLKFGSSGIEA